MFNHEILPRWIVSYRILSLFDGVSEADRRLVGTFDKKFSIPVCNDDADGSMGVMTSTFD